MNRRNQLLCAHGAIIVVVLLGAGWFFIPGWFPPIDPGLSADELQAIYAADRHDIRIGVTICAFSGVFWWTLSAAIAGQMRRIEGTGDPILSRVQMAAASGTVIVVLIASYFVLAAAYRPEMSASTIQIFNDFTWLLFIGAYPPAFLQNLSIGLCILGDKSGNRVYPRWLGYANLWFALLTLPGALLPFFHGGPFSWNGVIGFWLVAFFFFLWIIVNWWFTVQAIRNQPQNELAA